MQALVNTLPVQWLKGFDKLGGAMSKLKAIETYYRGYRFRSRTEARAMVLLDGLGVPACYELEGFVLPDGTYYLPDFYLPEQDAFLEIKPFIKFENTKKIRELWKATGKACLVMDSEFNFRIFDSQERLWNDPGPCGAECQIYRCTKCHKVNFISLDNSYQCLCCHRQDGDSYLGFCSELESAIKAAKQARFEFGENK